MGVVLFVAILLAIFVGIPYWISRSDKADQAAEKARVRQASMAYLRNHGGSAVGLEKFLVDSMLIQGSYRQERAKLEAELALAQYRQENPLEPDDLIPREIPFRPKREK